MQFSKTSINGPVCNHYKSPCCPTMAVCLLSGFDKNLKSFPKKKQHTSVLSKAKGLAHESWSIRLNFVSFCPLKQLIELDWACCSGNHMDKAPDNIWELCLHTHAHTHTYLWQFEPPWLRHWTLHVVLWACVCWCVYLQCVPPHVYDFPLMIVL